MLKSWPIVILFDLRDSASNGSCLISDGISICRCCTTHSLDLGSLCMCGCLLAKHVDSCNSRKDPSQKQRLIKCRGSRSACVRVVNECRGFKPVEACLHLHAPLSLGEPQVLRACCEQCPILCEYFLQITASSSPDTCWHSLSCWTNVLSSCFTRPFSQSHVHNFLTLD